MLDSNMKAGISGDPGGQPWLAAPPGVAGQRSRRRPRVSAVSDKALNRGQIRVYRKLDIARGLVGSTKEQSRQAWHWQLSSRRLHE
ncbi:hypothetical protein NL676_022485 [Syzygium grande]|nr:hypothetical protein NL676_022485 [Syzygium grande]